MTGHPLRPANRLSLGGPLPRQLADGPQAHPQAIACKQRPSFTQISRLIRVLCGISVSFETLSPTQGQITYVLLTRAPLNHFRRSSCVRLACVKRAANVRSEPGSNSPVKLESEPERTVHSYVGNKVSTRRRCTAFCEISFAALLRRLPSSAFCPRTSAH